MSLAATFGRFRIIHSGHINLIRNMASIHSNVLVGISESSISQGSAEVLESLVTDLNNVEIQYYKSPFKMLKYIPNITHFYVGSDRLELITSLQKYYDISGVIVKRKESDPSSTRCREIYGEGSDINRYIDEGLAINKLNALTIISQNHLEMLFSV